MTQANTEGVASVDGFIGTSRAVEGQPEPRYAAVERLLMRHRHREFARPRDNASQAAVDAVVHRIVQAKRQGQSVILDLGCGTGQSTLAHALRNPQALVVGIDKSLARLGKRAESCTEAPDRRQVHSSGAWWVRANSIDVVAALHEQAVQLDEVWLLYPNPWPKTQHLAHRWYGHPLFAALVNMSLVLECRTNWEVYAREFAFATKVLGRLAQVQPWTSATPLTAFERKYVASGHCLWQVRCSS